MDLFCLTTPHNNANFLMIYALIYRELITLLDYNIGIKMIKQSLHQHLYHLLLQFPTVYFFKNAT